MPMSTTVGSRDHVSSARWPVPEERRTVSVLFADIVGSTGLTERLDPEDVRALQRVYFDTVAGVLRRWNGVVEKYIGDAVMALFGAHASDGFDAYRAVRAGLEIQQAVDRRTPAGVRLRVRVGVATGEVLVDLAATRDGGHGTASGAVITTAARLQEYAPPGAVVVCAATRRATAGLLEQRPLASMTVAGKALPLDVWRVTGTSRTRPAPHHGPLVGRRRELATAGDEITRAVRDRRPRWISLAGPAGSGRSRLLHELARAVSTVDGTPVRWCVAHCPPYAQGGLAPLADMVRGFAGVRDGDLPATVRRRLAAALDGLLPPAARGPAAYALAELVAAPEDSGAADRGADAWRLVLLELAAGRPVVVAVDDLDRAAPAMNRFLHRLFAAATERRLRLAVVATHGSGWADLVPGAGDRRRRVPLPPLGTVDTGRLLRHLLGGAGRPAALARDLLPLVGGNPAVAAAYVRALDEDGGAPAGPVPDPVRRIVDPRLDRLDGDHRAVLMAGAALGARFAAGAVERLLGWAPGRAGPVLRGLVARGLLRRPARDGYAVAEPAVAQVARHRLTRAVRAEFARRAGARLGFAEPAQPARGRQPRHPVEVMPRRTPLAGTRSRPARRERTTDSGAVTPDRTGPARAGIGAAGGHAEIIPPVPVHRLRPASSTPVRAAGGGTPPGLATVGPPAAGSTTGRPGTVVPLVGSPRPAPSSRRRRPVAPVGNAAPSVPVGSPVRLSDATVRRRRTGPAAAGPILRAAA
ncbi:MULTISPECIES: AAA family ATPase [Micromonospora]|uniref:Adenylate/guanylate cyclase domain-containing protein n=1 Tax=Micromonospora sicca TaxID=2202420 RepID=A0ABU5JHU2_9ACTN|nr:adenylate/guanylate cyclase domain-containing protein [Micromonospora sp. 4G53]MDZ5492077.1 adenylate/guanylate cyclase domain-containing protein [Micromonospora sp. 4G53]